MTTRTAKYNASPLRELIRYRIEIKSGRIWKPLIIYGVAKTFDNPYHANNYGLQFNKFHKILT